MNRKLARGARAIGTLAIIGTTAFVSAGAMADTHNLKVDPLVWYYNLYNGKYVTAGVRNAGSAPAPANQLTYGVMVGTYPSSTIQALTQSVPAGIAYSATKRYMAATTLDSGTHPTNNPSVMAFAFIQNTPSDSNTGDNMQTSSAYLNMQLPQGPVIYKDYDELLLNPYPTDPSGQTNPDLVVTLTLIQDVGIVPSGYEVTLVGPDEVPGNPITVTVPAGVDVGDLIKPTHDAKADINGDGKVDGADLAILLGAWGFVLPIPGCPDSCDPVTLVLNPQPSRDPPGNLAQFSLRVTKTGDPGRDATLDVTVIGTVSNDTGVATEICRYRFTTASE